MIDAPDNVRAILEKVNQNTRPTITERNILAEWLELDVRFEEVTLEDVDSYINRHVV